jgi:hypothetical protein
MRNTTLLALGLTLAGCNQYWERKETVAFSAGDAVATNAALQVPDPWPRNVGNTNIPMDGDKARLAYDRYRKGAVGLGKPTGGTTDIAPTMPTQ